jgi:F-type H+-transporting ATPase subunit delta
MVSGVAERYAKALLDLAEEEKTVDSVDADLDRFAGLIAESSDLARLVRSPVFSAEEQEKAVTAVLAKAGITGAAGNFIRLVAAKRRLFVLPSMINAYKAMVAEKKGIVGAEVTLAEQPSPKRLEDIKSALREVAGSEIALDVKINPAIIGGLIVKLGSRMIDASLRSKLNSIRLALKEVG